MRGRREADRLALVITFGCVLLLASGGALSMTARHRRAGIHVNEAGNLSRPPIGTLAEIIDAARRWGYAGIEFRGLQAELELDRTPEFGTRIAETRRRLQDAGLRATCLSSSVQVVTAGLHEVERKQAIATVRTYLEMAKAVDAPFVRVFGGEMPAALSPDDAISRAVATLREVGDDAQARGVTVLVETHDAFIDSTRLANLIRATDHAAVQVLWDIHHPYRLNGESIAMTVRQLAPHLRYTHVKDSSFDKESERATYVPVGQGDVPIREALYALLALNYDGYLTLEWEKRWHPDLDPPEVILPHYAEQMREWLAE
jgi:sugar phosphate isomerase/epimerase